MSWFSRARSAIQASLSKPSLAAHSKVALPVMVHPARKRDKATNDNAINIPFIVNMQVMEFIKFYFVKDTFLYVISLRIV